MADAEALPEASAQDTTLLARWRWPQALSLLGVIAAATTLGAFVLGKASVVPVLGAGYFACLAAVLLFLWRARTRPAGRPAAARVDAEGLWWAGRLVARREHLAKGALVPSVTHGTLVRLERGALRGPIELRVRSREDGRALLAALALDASHTVGVASALSPHHRASVALAVAGLVGLRFYSLIARGLGPNVGPVVALALLGVSFVGVVTYFVKRRVVVGTDGVLVTWAGTRRFFPMSELEDAAVHPSNPCAAQLFLRSGRSETLHFGAPGRRRRSLAAEDEARALVERVHEAIAASRAGASGGRAEALVRGGRTVDAWIASLRGAASREGTFRRAALAAADLWAVLQDGEAPAEARAAAAVALGGDAAARDRLRIAAQATAEPRLRVAIEAAAGDDEAHLAEALAALEEPS